jgi:hypothetical protein
MKKSFRNKTKRKGGAATVMPLQYYNPGAPQLESTAGHDLLKAIPPIGVRPRIGGRQITRKSKGGFVPTVMDGFVASASYYLVPVALFAGYSLLTKKRTKRNRHRHTRRK